MNRTRASIQKERYLVNQAQRGSADAFGQLVKMYQDRLFNVVARITRCRSDAEDVVQDAFVQAYVKLDTFRHGSTFYTWLYRIAVNMAISYNRQRKPPLSLDLGRETEGLEPIDQRASPDSRILRREEAMVIERALAALSDEHRTILLLRGVEGFNYEAIGEVLELNPGTVRSRLHRARAHLREELGSQHHHAPR